MANFTCLAAARTAMLERLGWDVESDGLFGAPPLTVVIGEETHPSVTKVLGLLGVTTSTQILAVSETIKKAGVPTLVGGSAVAVTRQGNPWMFRVRPDDSIVAQGMIKYIKEEMKLSKVGILHDADAFGTGGGDLVERYAMENGLIVVKREKEQWELTENDLDIRRNIYIAQANINPAGGGASGARRHAH